MAVLFNVIASTVSKSAKCKKIGDKNNFFRFVVSFQFLSFPSMASEVAAVKSHHGISVKCSQYRDTGPTNPSLTYSTCIVYVFAWVCLFVSLFVRLFVNKITQKLMDGF